MGNGGLVPAICRHKFLVSNKYSSQSCRLPLYENGNKREIVTVATERKAPRSRCLPPVYSS